MAAQSSATPQTMNSNAAKAKVVKGAGVAASKLEEMVSGALWELQVTSQDLKSDLRSLFISGAKEIDVGGDRKAIVLFVPPRLLKTFRKIHVRLVRELEKKFSGKHIVIVAQRTVLPRRNKSQHQLAQPRPNSRTLTAVHESILEDLTFPAEIAGKRTAYRVDGSRLIKMFVSFLLFTFFSFLPCLTLSLLSLTPFYSILFQPP